MGGHFGDVLLQASRGSRIGGNGPNDRPSESELRKSLDLFGLHYSPAELHHILRSNGMVPAFSAPQSRLFRSSSTQTSSTQMQTDF